MIGPVFPNVTPVEPKSIHVENPFLSRRAFTHVKAEFLDFQRVPVQCMSATA
jgi:hypothetical protein